MKLTNTNQMIGIVVDLLWRKRTLFGKVIMAWGWPMGLLTIFLEFLMEISAKEK